MYRGRLPKDISIRYARIANAYADVRGNETSADIRINRQFSGDFGLSRRELIHEIVHVAPPRWKHSHRFHMEMMRIIRKIVRDYQNDPIM